MSTQYLQSLSIQNFFLFVCSPLFTLLHQENLNHNVYNERQIIIRMITDRFLSLTLSQLTALSVLRDIFPFVKMSSILDQIFFYGEINILISYHTLRSLNIRNRINKCPKTIVDEAYGEIVISDHTWLYPKCINYILSRARLLKHSITLLHSLPKDRTPWNDIYQQIQNDSDYEEIVNRGRIFLHNQSLNLDLNLNLDSCLQNIGIRSSRACQILYMWFWLQEQFNIYKTGNSFDLDNNLIIQRALNVRNASIGLMVAIRNFQRS